MVWKNIDGSNYSVSSCGKIKNNITQKTLKPQNKNGYLCVKISINGETKKYFIHRIVAQYFCDGYWITTTGKSATVNHKDYDRTNNHYTNLEWISREDNIKHAWKKRKMSI